MAAVHAVVPCGIGKTQLSLTYSMTLATRQEMQCDELRCIVIIASSAANDGRVCLEPVTGRGSYCISTQDTVCRSML
jgi:hypothetical protein